MKHVYAATIVSVIIAITVLIGIEISYNKPDTSKLNAREKHIYAELHNEYFSQRNLLLERYRNHFQSFEASGHVRRSATYDELEKQLPTAAKLLASLPDSINVRQTLIIVTPDELVSLQNQIALVRYHNYGLINEFSMAGCALMEWRDKRARYGRPYLLIGISAAKLMCVTPSPLNLDITAPYPCDESNQCLTLTEAIALLTVHPAIMDAGSAMLVAGSMQRDYGTVVFPYIIRHGGSSLRLDIWYPETKQDTVEWWAPQCVTRLW